MLPDNCEFRDNGLSEKHDSPWGLIYICPIFKFFSIFYKILYGILLYDFFFLEVIATFLIIAAVKVTAIEGRQRIFPILSFFIPFWGTIHDKICPQNYTE